MDNPLKPICKVIVHDGYTPIITDVLPTNDDVAWCFLVKLGTSHYAYDFKKMEFRSISRVEYMELLEKCHSVELRTTSNKTKNVWLELPISSQPLPGRKVFDSVVPRSQVKPEQDVLETYARTEKLLNDLIKD